MFTAFFLTFIFLHIGFGLALAFFVFYLAEKTEGKLRNFGGFVGGLLVILAILTAISAPFAVAKKHHYYKMHERMHHEDMIKQGEKTGGACPVYPEK